MTGERWEPECTFVRKRVMISFCPVGLTSSRDNKPWRNRFRPANQQTTSTTTPRPLDSDAVYLLLMLLQFETSFDSTPRLRKVESMTMGGSRPRPSILPSTTFSPGFSRITGSDISGEFRSEIYNVSTLPCQPYVSGDWDRPLAG